MTHGVAGGLAASGARLREQLCRTSLVRRHSKAITVGNTQTVAAAPVTEIAAVRKCLHRFSRPPRSLCPQSAV